MLKKIFGLLALIVALNFSVANAATQPVTDKAGLLSASDIEIKIGVVFVKSVNGDIVGTVGRAALC